MVPLGPLGERLRQLGRVVLGFSGGVDSGLLAVVGARTMGPGDFLAVMGLSPSFPQAQRRQARELALRFAVPLEEVDTRELDDPRYVANPTTRCRFCKAELWSRLRHLAETRGFTTLIDGTHAGDMGEHRPGLAAGAQYGVRSPLAELGWSKAAVREAARALGLPIWDAPAAPCLASRIRFGLPVTVERLRQVEAAEAYLRRLGVTGDLRVRHLGEEARVEAEPGAFPLLEARWPDIVEACSHLGFSRVVRDPAGYRRGAMVALAGGL